MIKLMCRKTCKSVDIIDFKEKNNVCFGLRTIFYLKPFNSNYKMIWDTQYKYMNQLFHMCGQVCAQCEFTHNIFAFRFVQVKNALR